jgi:hypothetical protein
LNAKHKNNNSKIGAGSATIIESKLGEFVRQRMDWKRAMEGTSTVEFMFKPADGKAVVTWVDVWEKRFHGQALQPVYGLQENGQPTIRAGTHRTRQSCRRGFIREVIQPHRAPLTNP